MGAKIWFNGVDLNKFGPTPFINLSKAVNRDGANVHILSETINITLEGKITAYKKGISEQAHKPGIDRLLEDEKMLRDLFSRDGILEVTCSASNSTQQPTHGAGKFGFWWDANVASSRGTIGKGLACKVTSYQISKTDDNWVNSIDYTIELQCNHSKSATLGHAVHNTISGFTDEWTIEPVEDAAYYNLQILNNNPTASNPPDWPTGQRTLDNLIQYRISHRVGAQGLSAPTGFYQAGVVPGAATPYHGESAWFNAKRFVEEQLKMPHNNINHVFLAYNNTGFGQHSYTTENKQTGSKTQNEEIYLYNHVRAVNVSESNGTYDVTDTWLALSKPTHYLEDYSVEVTQDTNFNVTARINGTVTGLEIKKDGYIEGSALQQTMVHNTYNGTWTPNMNGGKIDLQNMNEMSIYSTKYGNALDAWRNYVEPLLYARTNVLALYMVQGATTTLTTGSTATRSTAPTNYNNSAWTGKIPQMNDLGTFQVRYPQNNFGTCDYLDKRENIILDTRFVSKTIGSDPARGTITYSCEFNNRRGANQIKGATILSLNVQDSKPADVVAEMFVMGRKRGPILQDTGSKTAKTRQVSIEIQTVIPRNMAEFDMRYNACPMWTGGIVYRDLMNILDMLRPVLPDTWTPVKLQELRAKDSSIALINGSYAGQVYIKSDDETWNPIEGRFSKNITWVYDA